MPTGNTSNTVEPSGPPSQPVLSDKAYVLLTIGCLGALLAFRLAALYASKIDLVMDEAQYWTWSHDFEFGYFSKPPLIAWIIGAMSEVCGVSEACTRAASPILYALASLLIFATGRVLFDARTGFWAAIVFATLPGVSYASALITTDAPLILLWTLTLFLWVLLVKHKTMGLAILLGLAIGIGLLAKQAMIYAILCIACHAIVSRDAREALLGGRAIVAGIIALALFSPNIVWNAQHGYPTAKHTGANIGWRPPYLHPAALAEFIGAQFALFGPILLAVLARAGLRHVQQPRDPNKTLLLCFTIPILTILILQALLSRAHGNWAATAYPAASLFVTAVLLEHGRRVLLAISLGLHLVVAAAIAIVPSFASSWGLFERLEFLRSAIGWEETADAVRSLLSEQSYGAVLVDTRDMAAELLYYMRDARVPLYIWARGLSPHNHYEMTRPFTAGTPEPILFVSLRPCRKSITRHFDRVTVLKKIEVPLVQEETRTVYACRLSGFQRTTKTK